MRDRRLIQSAVAAGVAGGPYEPDLLALREGPLLEAAARTLVESPELLLVHATGRDIRAPPGSPSSSAPCSTCRPSA